MLCSLSIFIWFGLKYGLWNKTGGKKNYNIDPIRSMFCIYGLSNLGAEILGGKVGQRQLTSYDHHGKSIRQFQIDILENELNTRKGRKSSKMRKIDEEHKRKRMPKLVSIVTNFSL